MVNCAKCGKEIPDSGNIVRLRVFGANGALHWTCLETFLRAGAGNELEWTVYRAGQQTTAKPAAPAPGSGKQAPGQVGVR